MSAVGNGSLVNDEFKENTVLPVNSVTSTGGVSSNYTSKLVGGKKRRKSSISLSKNASLRSYRHSGLAKTLRLMGGKRRSRKSRKSKK
jgi:hypothetical protein